MLNDLAITDRQLDLKLIYVSAASNNIALYYHPFGIGNMMTVKINITARRLTKYVAKSTNCRQPDI